MLVDEIREAFANLNYDRIAPLRSLPFDAPGSVYRHGEAYGVAIDLVDNPLEVSERFSGARLYTTTAYAGNQAQRQLRLECAQINLRNEFAVVCAQFLHPGDLGSGRRELLAAPLRWWEQWRQLLGNALREKRPWSVLGELLAWERLLVLGMSPRWRGPENGSHDLETTDASYEVKSTLTKYESRITVAGQFQLQTKGDRPLFLVFQRFEPTTAGDSIDATVRRLLHRGADRDALDTGLRSLGFEPGASGRTEQYRLLESLRFRVDEAFPRVTPASFVGGALPPGVVSFQYSVDLGGLASEVFQSAG